MKSPSCSKILWIIIALGGIFFPLLSQAHPLDHWHWRNPSTVGSPLYQVTYGEGLFVAVGAWGGIYTSSDGVFWNDEASGTEEALLTIGYGSGRFVAHGHLGTVLVSEDGKRWAKMPEKLPAWIGLTATAYGNGTFVAVGDFGRIHISPDGIQWTLVGEGKDLSDIIYADGMFVAVGAEGTILTSPNGTTWTQRASGTTLELSGITHGNDLFVSVGRKGTILISPDGKIWSPSNSGITKELESITYGEGTFAVAGGEAYTCASSILTSVDGVTWTEKQSGGGCFQKMAYGNGLFVGVGYRELSPDLSGAVVTSSDGEVWSVMDRGPLATFGAGTYGRDQFVITGIQGAILTSADGAVWTVRQSSETYDDSIFAVAYGNETYVALGKDGQILTSPDGRTWVENKRDVCQSAMALHYVNDLFVMLGNAENICTSSDGTSWTRRSSGPSARLRSVAYGNGLFVAVGERQTILTSEDGLTWTERHSSPNVTLSAVAYGNGLFVAAGGLGTLLTSTDGINWVRRTYQPSEAFPSLYGLNSIAYGNGAFVVAGEYGLIVASNDGVTWKVQSDTFTHYNMPDVVFGNGLFVVAGPGPGAIMTSPDGVTWTTGVLGTEDYLYKIAYGNGKFVAAAWYGTVLTSSDGTVWNIEDEQLLETPSRLVFGNGMFIGFTAWGNTYTSPDGVNWTFRDPGNYDTIWDAVYRDGGFVGVGENIWGTASFSSADGLTWEANVIGSGVSLTSVAYGNGLFVAVGNGLVTSSDGVVWKVREAQGGTGITYGKGIFVMVEGGIIRISSDGLTWTETYRHGYLTLSGISYGKDTFVAVGTEWSASSIVLYSSDGIHWKRSSLRTIVRPRGITYGEDSFVIWGEQGMIMQSHPLTFPSFYIDPDSHDFGSGYLGETSPLQEFVVSNAGYSDLAIGAIALTGQEASDFIIGNDTCSGRSIPPLGACSVEVVFRPISTGSRTAFLGIPSDDPETPEALVVLTGLSLGPEINVSPTAIDFKNVPPGQADQQTIFVGNDGALDLVIYDIVGPGASFEWIGGTCKIGDVIKPGAQCTITLRFIPVAGGRYSSTLAIMTNDPDQSLSVVDLRGISGPELIGFWDYLERDCRETGRGLRCKIEGLLYIENIGTLDSPSVILRFYLSDDRVYDQGDRFLKQMNTGALGVNQVKLKKFSYKLAPGETVADKYLLVVFD